jgi:thiamine-phosphate pyrophosphorylase
MSVDLRTYLVTDSALCGGRGVVETVRLAALGGVSVVQVRETTASARELCALTRAVIEAVSGTRVSVVVNDRIDVALAVGAHGVHVGQSDLHPEHARRLLGPAAVVGLSVSSGTQVTDALALTSGCLDYLGVGPVFATPTKPEAAVPLGLEGTARLVDAAGDLPCVAIGGIDLTNVAEVRATGVAGVAVVSAVCTADDPSVTAAALAGDHR